LDSERRPGPRRKVAGSFIPSRFAFARETLTFMRQSYLDIEGCTAHFHGNLDITALGGAGFASQRTTGDDRSWNLSGYDGIHLNLGAHDGKKYTLTLKDEILPLLEDGREQSSLSYEYDFDSKDEMDIFVPWQEMKATYRGTEQKDARPLDVESVKRMSLMMRRYECTLPDQWKPSI